MCTNVINISESLSEENVNELTMLLFKVRLKPLGSTYQIEFEEQEKFNLTSLVLPLIFQSRSGGSFSIRPVPRDKENKKPYIH
ncbi:unnamed protein product, partial [Schistosoma turkestanicum]